MSAYVVMIRERVTNEAEMAQYRELAPLARKVVSLKPLAFYGPHENWEGLPADGVVILEFENMEAARTWYHSPQYQEALKHRLSGSEYRVMMVEGVPPRPAS